VAEDHLERLKRAFELADVRNPEAIFELLAPDVEFIVSGKDPTAGVWHGHAGVVEFFTSWGESWEKWEAHPERFVAVGENQVAVGFHQRARGRVSGIDVENHPAHLWTFRDGLAVRWEIHPSMDDALSAAEPAS
jgi:ketosteroid isomerase-like protein